ncbi:class I SAM-dependent methyltransferase [Nodularia spumigena CS-584]|uniref:class I SAM-dependent methyltransferase n=1 Tax=Nodularia spumigena TaxID=70799 RepID=UPI0000EA94DB|nr:class I SAM-dependent methyltransferase [Nodularia spumigena]AHJ31301.1 putative 3-demethylubiquinone-9 3-O-methyltransferase [Nodularia spumigena CCY9414]EAW44780.1 s-adenosylmethionine (SAM)-dependent methyltransferase [Nodularia spumigena CCY9414]MDB9380721.1 class I SAM-dependent methyltransferase [Nodularia spumigena CS-584]
MRRYYDPNKKALVYIQSSATPEMWDAHWSITDEDKARLALIPPQKLNFVASITRRYLTPEDGLILEGGCGTGNHVVALTSAGYQALGIDFAPQTVAMLNKVAPHLDIRVGDVRSLPLSDQSVAGYWSLGVIEHFYSGYDSISHEMRRVIKSGGYLFLTHPYMSPLRKLKRLLRLFDYQSLPSEPSDFYQFALDHQQTIMNFCQLGFSLCEVCPSAGLKGFKDELPSFFKSPLQKLYDYSGKSILVRGLRYILDKVLSPLCGHSCLIVFRRH